MENITDQKDRRVNPGNRAEPKLCSRVRKLQETTSGANMEVHGWLQIVPKYKDSR